jgi:hypothetical protein
MEKKYGSVYATLSAVNVNGHTEKKNGLTYLSWAWAWAELLKAYPGSTYTVYENRDGWNYHTDGKTAWVKTGVTVEGIEYIEMLPVMDVRNRSIPIANITSMDVNKAIQRSLTKAVARHGLGLYIYAGEDLPETDTEEEDAAPAPVDAEIGKLRGAILDLADGDVNRVNAFLARAVKGAPKLDDLNLEQLNAVYDILANRVSKEAKHE